MLKLYRRSQEAQINWIRKNPVKWIALNAILFAVFYAYIEWADRRERRRWQQDIPQD